MNTYIAYWASMNVLHGSVVSFVQICWITYSIEKSSKCIGLAEIFALYVMVIFFYYVHDLCSFLNIYFGLYFCVKFLIILFSLKAHFPVLLEFLFQIFKILLFLFIAFIFPAPFLANIIKISLTVLLWYLASADVRYAVSIHQQLRFHQPFNLPMFFSLWMNVSVETNLVLLDFHI